MFPDQCFQVICPEPTGARILISCSAPEKRQPRVRWENRCDEKSSSTGSGAGSAVGHRQGSSKGCRQQGYLELCVWGGGGWQLSKWGSRRHGLLDTQTWTGRAPVWGHHSPRCTRPAHVAAAACKSWHKPLVQQWERQPVQSAAPKGFFWAGNPVRFQSLSAGTTKSATIILVTAALLTGPCSASPAILLAVCSNSQYAPECVMIWYLNLLTVGTLLSSTLSFWSPTAFIQMIFIVFK